MTWLKSSSLPLACLWLLLTAAGAQAQTASELFGGFEQVGRSNRTAAATFQARLDPVPGTNEAVLSLKVEMNPQAWTYPIATGTATQTTVKLESESGLTPIDETFQPDRVPKREYDPGFMMELDKFIGGVTWSRRYRIDPGATAPRIGGEILFMFCDNESCTPRQETFSVALSSSSPVDTGDLPPIEELGTPVGEDSPAADLALGYLVTPTRPSRTGQSPDPIRLQFQLQPAGQGEWHLLILMELDAGWKTYALVPTDDQLEQPTVISIAELGGLEPDGEPETLTPAKLHTGEAGTTSNSHEGLAVWRQRFRETGSGDVGLRGSIRYQLCREECLVPYPFRFSLGSLQEEADVSLATAPMLTFDPPRAGLQIEVASSSSAGGIVWYLVLAFLGGLLLNIMPCVLPVIAIKILSFVQQAGESRGRVFALNLAYTGGVVSVFLVLAVLAVTIGLGWGTQFQDSRFQLAMTSLIFILSLSLLGVFEIPVPGLGGGSLHQREGLSGAFVTGIIATLLATPCSGPFMGTVFTWALSQPAWIVYSIFGTMGLGMASPYLIAGFFPAIVDWLPKPGMWMVRFKQFAGFVLMGTVIWMFYFISSEYHVPLLIFLLGLSLGLWMIGNLYDSASPPAKKWRVRSSALVAMGLLSATAYFVHHGFGNELPWEPFSEARMTEVIQEGRPLLIDFTADWCGICKQNEVVALNRQGTREFVEAHNVVTLLADYTGYSAEIRKWLHEFQQESVPLTVIIPPRRDSEPLRPILLTGPYSQATLLEKLEQAVLGGAPAELSRQETGEVSRR